MKLRPEFESARAGLINRTPVPSLDVCLGELLREEQRLASQLGIAQDAGGTEMVNVAYAAHDKGRYKSPPQCYSCKEVGHIAKHCRKKFCNYCKKEGHIIKDCRVRPQNRSAPAFHTTVQSSFVPASSAQPTTVPGSSSNITPEQVQQMIVSALSALGLQGKKYLLSSPWLIDSAASNHMTGSPAALQDVRKYDGEQHIQIADGNTLPITAVGNLGSSFTNVFVSPALSANLISVGQLVEENFSLHFDRSGCRVQDQASGLEIAKGPKVGRLFPLQSFSIPRSISVGYSAIANNSHFWHKKLGHSNSVILTHLMKHGHLSNTNAFSSLSFDCAPCKLGKSKSLPFPLQGSRASTCFEIIHSDVWDVTGEAVTLTMPKRILSSSDSINARRDPRIEPELSYSCFYVVRFLQFDTICASFSSPLKIQRARKILETLESKSICGESRVTRCN
ncbi:hypothetical protein LWI29_037641 [Acer saccharum]|uniref:CCHC-type domain-containing protein n=1 Tax=Acer saccharum TaxID=4024 RepID=A0AA39RPK3_ACESA|nr:hypothetical protein LWI29_037641 [Acer saccharum]